MPNLYKCGKCNITSDSWNCSNCPKEEYVIIEDKECYNKHMEEKYKTGDQNEEYEECSNCKCFRETGGACTKCDKLFCYECASDKEHVLIEHGWVEDMCLECYNKYWKDSEEKEKVEPVCGVHILNHEVKTLYPYQCEEGTPYEKWCNSYSRASDHLLLSAFLREYYDEIDDLIVEQTAHQHSNVSDAAADVQHKNFAEDMFKLEMQLQNKLSHNYIMDLYLMRQEKNAYIADLRKIIVS